MMAWCRPSNKPLSTVCLLMHIRVTRPKWVQYCYTMTLFIMKQVWLCKLRLFSANHRQGYWSNLPCDWLSTAWAHSKQETINRQLRLCSANHRPGYWSNMPCDWLSTAWAYSEFCVLDHSVLLCCSKIITPKIPVRPWPICHWWSTLKPTMIDAAYCSGHIAIRSLSEDINHCKLHISGLIDLLTYKSKHSILSSNIVKAKK